MGVPDGYYDPAPHLRPAAPARAWRPELPSVAACKEGDAHAREADDLAHQMADGELHLWGQAMTQALLAVAAEVRALRYSLAER